MPDGLLSAHGPAISGHAPRQRKRRHRRREVDAGHLAVARAVGIGIGYRIPAPEHASRHFVVGARVAHAVGPVPHAREAALRQAQVLLVAEGLIGPRQRYGPPHDVVVDEPPRVLVVVVEVETRIVRPLALEYAAAEIAVHACTPTLAAPLGQRRSVHRHVPVYGLAPYRSRAVETVNGGLHLGVALVDVFAAVEIHLVEGIVGPPYLAHADRRGLAAARRSGTLVHTRKDGDSRQQRKQKFSIHHHTTFFALHAHTGIFPDAAHDKSTKKAPPPRAPSPPSHKKCSISDLKAQKICSISDI